MSLRVGINGFGRIGRAIFRVNLKIPRFEIVAINDINPDNRNIAYLLKYDSTYGRLENEILGTSEGIALNGRKIGVFHEQDIANVPWHEEEVDVVIDSSGVHRNLFSMRTMKEKGVKHCVVTNSPKEEEVDVTVVIGVNEGKIDKKRHFIISGSICDANAFVPVANVLDREFGIEHGFLTTLHPWLGYQNLLDGPSISYATPGEIYDHYALGRSSVNSLIPKTTSAISASCKVLKQLTGKFLSLSYRVPTAIVSSADVSIKLRKSADANQVRELFIEEARKQRYKIFYNCDEGLVSTDFAGFDYSSVIDHRWIMVNDANYLKMILWYDNEWGYSSRIADLVEYLGNK